MKDVIFQGSRNRAPSGMAEVVLHLLRDETIEHEPDIEDIDSTLEEIDDQTITIEALEADGGVRKTRMRLLRFIRRGETKTVKMKRCCSAADVPETSGKRARTLRLNHRRVEIVTAESVTLSTETTLQKSSSQTTLATEADGAGICAR